MEKITRRRCLKTLFFALMSPALMGHFPSVAAQTSPLRIHSELRPRREAVLPTFY